jgi:hypothetical protein
MAHCTQAAVASHAIPNLDFGKQSHLDVDEVFDFIGERDGIRTHDLLIKSQMLYQLSYALHKKRGWSSRIDAAGQ